MAVAMRLLWLLPIAISACEPAPRERLPDPPTPAAAAAPRRTAIAAARAEVRTALALRLPTPRRLRQVACPKFELANERERELGLAVVDARYDTRSVLPLEVTRHLIQPDLHRIDAVLAGIERPDELDAALETAQRLAGQRFIGAYHVIHYKGPKWYVKTSTMRPAWDAGRLDAWFVVHDAKSGEALCSTRIQIAGDATGAPLRVRLRSDTRDRLARALGERMRAATSPALAAISNGLVLPGVAATAVARR